MLADYSGGQIRRMVENVVLIIFSFDCMERVYEGKGGTLSSTFIAVRLRTYDEVSDRVSTP
mgnify:CR=1 FL=1